MKITWLPYELHPGLPPEGIPRDVYFRGRDLDAIRGHLKKAAAEVGLQMEQRDVIINSRPALAAAELAREKGLYEAMHRALFEAHWQGTARLEVVDDVVRVGESVGLDGAELRAALEDRRFEPVIDEYRAMAESAGINAIPAHIFDRRYLVTGAQPSEVFRQVLERLAAEA